MTLNSKTIGLLLLLLSFAIVDASAQGPWGKTAAVVYMDKRGKIKKEASVQVQDHAAAGLSFTKSGKLTLVSNDSVISIKFNSEHEGWTGALDLVKGSFYADALDAFALLLGDERGLRRSPWVRQEALYQIWVCHRLMGRLSEAQVAAANLRAAAPEGRYIPELDLAAANNLLAQGKKAKAASAFRKIQQFASKGRFAESIGVRSLSGLFELAIQSNDTAAAKKVADEISRASNSTEGALIARILSGRVLVVEKKYSNALSLFATVLKDAKRKQESVIAGAANGLGDCYFAMGKFADAQREYSKTASLFYDKPALQEQTGWAVWQWAVACKRVANSTEDEASRKLNTSRYKKLRRRAANDFPFTRGGRLAAREMGR